MIVNLLVSLGLLVSMAMVVLARPVVKHTSLTSAWKWSLLAILAWNVLWLADRVLKAVPEGLSQQLWYVQAVLMLVPLIDVLGARRPMNRAWPFFVLVPMMLVLTWPVWVAWFTAQQMFELEAPSTLAYFLILIMGAGNYVGTRFGGPAFLLTASLFLLAGSLSTLTGRMLPAPATSQIWASILLVLASLWMYIQLLGNSVPSDDLPLALHRYFLLWEDFRDLFGLVWAIRVMNRLNQIGQQENWQVEIELDEFMASHDPDPATMARIDHHFRWMLRRFTDSEWIDKRLGRNLTSDPDVPLLS